MDKIKFNVSSKTAKLIGRENISDSNGAIIELVKNAYDADASSVYIKFDIRFEVLPNEFSYSSNKEYFSLEEMKLILSYYNQDGDKLFKKDEISDVEEEELKKVFFRKNRIIILDNGYGMNDEIIKNVWMNIGTNDKEINISSKKGRVKTGSKGIGRFALEKLSLCTEVYSKKEDCDFVYWGIDWSQFDQVSLLNNIEADFNYVKEDFRDIILRYFTDDELEKCGIDGKNGTLIILDGTRENWSEKIFERINNNLKSINPFGNVDQFDVYIDNIYREKYSFASENSTLSETDYDYRIRANYDGKETVTIALFRNEVDLKAEKQDFEFDGKVYAFDINEFWEREAFKKKNYKKEDYAKEIVNKYLVTDLLNDNIKDIQKIGAFSLEIYFLKSGNNKDFQFVKEIKVNARKRLTNNFSGIKIYRDNFKVRPYGEFGPMHDWLELGRRVQSSPAGITHPTGSWRVNTYQLIGSILISRLGNPNLEDMANREALTLNDTYYLFIDLLQSIISKFEYDRQYIYREYKKWKDQKEAEITNSRLIERSIVEEKENNKKSDDVFSTEELKEAIYNVSNERDYSDEVKKLLMAFSVAGTTASTFAHEMNGVSLELASRNKQLRYCIDNLLSGKEFNGPEYYNPYLVIDAYEEIDILLGKWLELVMKSVKDQSLEIQTINLNEFFQELKNDWDGILNLKQIKFLIEEQKNVSLNMAKIDLFSIFNNLILNAAHYLEEYVHAYDRIIRISYVEINNDYIKILFENNGPALSSKFENTPDIIFNAKVSDKEGGTGLGLWICQETINRYGGEIHVVPSKEDFKIEMKLFRK